MKVLSFVTVGVMGLAAATVVFAHPEGSSESAHAQHAAHHHGAFSAEHMAMHNLIVAAVATKTGRSQDDIAKMFEQDQGHPQDVGKQLGLDEDAMRGIFVNAHRTLIERMQAARLITPDQAEKLKAAPMPMHHSEAQAHGTGDSQ